MEYRNKKARFNYHIEQTYVAGVQLTGTEVKSLREHKGSISEAHCLFIGEELFIRNMHISEYKQGSHNNHEPLRDRKLLLQKRELKKLLVKAKDKGIAIFPLRLFLSKRGLYKMEIGYGRGKKLYDKRDDLKEKDLKRDLERQL